MGAIKSKTRGLRKSDWVWLLGYPLYQGLGTLRHEGSHALAAWLEGAKIVEFAWLPSYLPGTGFVWGFVRWHGKTDWLAIAAPYFVDLLTFALFALICTRLRFRRHWLWLNFVIIGMISPLANTVYNYTRIGKPFSDAGRLAAVLPPALVHGYFLLTIGLYLWGLRLVLFPPSSGGEASPAAGTNAD